jgi:thioredoxin-like negative regulator of GroEL
MKLRPLSALLLLPCLMATMAGCEAPSRTDMTSEFVEVATDLNSSGVIGKSEKPVLVDFYSSTSGHCDSVSAIVDELAKKYHDKMKFVRVNGDENPSLTKTYHIDTFPTLLVFSSKNKVIMPLLGLRDKMQVEDYIKKALLTIEQ